jgi:hypothetical protein
MSLIKPRTRGKQFVQVRTRLERENYETLHAYAAFIGEDAEYVLNELLDGVLARDKAFIKWRGEHPQSFAPQAVPARPPEPRDHAASRPSPAVGGLMPSAPIDRRP